MASVRRPAPAHQLSWAAPQDGLCRARPQPWHLQEYGSHWAQHGDPGSTPPWLVPSIAEPRSPLGPASQVWFDCCLLSPQGAGRTEAAGSPAERPSALPVAGLPRSPAPPSVPRPRPRPPRLGCAAFSTVLLLYAPKKSFQEEEMNANRFSFLCVLFHSHFPLLGARAVLTSGLSLAPPPTAPARPQGSTGLCGAGRWVVSHCCHPEGPAVPTVPVALDSHQAGHRRENSTVMWYKDISSTSYKTGPGPTCLTFRPAGVRRGPVGGRTQEAGLGSVHADDADQPLWSPRGLLEQEKG